TALATGIDFEDLAAHAPGIVVCAITPWGSAGPYADFTGEELSVCHGPSWGFLSPAGATKIDHAPLKAPGRHVSIMCCTLAAPARSGRTGRSGPRRPHWRRRQH